jgi:hypothetical protein
MRGSIEEVDVSGSCYNGDDMEPTAELIDELTREDIVQARNTPPSVKLRAGGDRFDDACRWMLAGIQREYPHITESAAMDELRRRLRMAEALEDRL